MNNIRIEEVGDVHSKYNYLEVFYKDILNPFLEISILENKELSFKFYDSKAEVIINIEDLEYILSSSKDFLPQAIKNEEDFLNFIDK